MTPAVKAFVLTLLERVEQLTKQVEDLTDQVQKLTPRNSSLPPSTEHPHAKPERNLQIRPGRRGDRGGRPPAKTRKHGG